MEPATNKAFTTVPEEKSPDQTDGARISKAAKVATKVDQVKIPKGSNSSCEKNPAWPFKSSETNYEIAKEEYSKSPVKKFVATAFGDELPAMRNELIERKHSGEGFVERHVHAWSHLKNWEVDPESENKQKSDPIVFKEDSDSKKKATP